MNKMVLNPKAGVKLRKVGNQYMIVEANEENANMSDVYSLNHTAALLWQQVEKGGTTPDMLADYLCENFEIDKEVAINDIERQMAEWKSFGLYNPQIQIFAESETKRPFFECSFKTKRTKKGLAHNTNNKARNKSQNHSISGFVKHNSTGNIIAFK